MRQRAMEEILGPLNLKAITSREVRNSIEHFDEELDKLNAQFLDAAPPAWTSGAYYAAFNIMSCGRSVSEEAVPKEFRDHIEALPTFPLRHYVVSGRRFYSIRGEWIDLQPLRDEAARIVERLFARFIAPYGTASMIVRAMQHPTTQRYTMRSVMQGAGAMLQPDPVDPLPPARFVDLMLRARAAAAGQPPAD